MTNKEKKEWLSVKYPLTIILDRYDGVYSGAKWLAFPLEHDEMPCAVLADDSKCAWFWENYKEPVGKGAYASDAVADLIQQMREFEPEESEDERIRQELVGGLMWQRDNLDRLGDHSNDLILPGFTMNVGTLLAWLEKQKPFCGEDDKTNGWAGEDLSRYLSCLQRLGTGNPQQPETINSQWFKEHCRPQSKPSWSEEDERILKGIIGLVDHDQHYGVSNKDMIAWLKSLRPQPKVEWSEEDVKRLYSIGTQIGFLKGRYSEYQKDVDWLHALAEKMGFHKCKIGEVVTEWKKENIDDKMLSKPKQEWSEEDEAMRADILDSLRRYQLSMPNYQVEFQMRWLKSLRPSWKPSEEQMKALQNAVALTACDKELVRLYNQLKKL